MIIDAATTAAVGGAVRLLMGDRGGLAAMDPSLDGFWRSFRAIVLLLPALLPSIAAESFASDGETGPALLAIVAAVLASYLLGWLLFPALLAGLARPLGLGRVYVGWMVARNWTAIPASIPYVVVVSAWVIGLLPVELFGLLTLTTLGFSLWCGWRVARIAGDQPPLAAVGFTLLDFLLGVVAETAIDRLFA